MDAKIIVWIVIIVVALFLIRLLRKWLKRLIFIVIILVIAFFIYGLFSSSGAAKLRYNVRTFPERVVSWFSDQTFLDYDNYKLNFSGDSEDTGKSGKGKSGKKMIEKSDENDVEVEDEVIVEKTKKTEKKDLVKDESEEDLSAQAFSDTPSIKFSDILNSKSNDDGDEVIYSQKEILGVINEYVEENLDDDNEILVTVTYDEESKTPERIVLQPQEGHGSAKSKNDEKLTEKISAHKAKSSQVKSTKIERVVKAISSETQEVKKEEKEYMKPIPQKGTTAATSNQTVSNGLSQADIKEAEYILGVLF